MRLLVELFFLCTLYGLGHWLTQWLHLPIPPVITGMLLFLLLLLSGAVKVEQLECSHRFFSRHFILFFIPVIVGIMQYWGLFRQGGFKLLLIITASTAVVLISTALSAKLLQRGDHDDER